MSFYIFAACLAIEFCRDPSRREERVRDEIVDRQTEDPRWLCFSDCYSLVYWRRRSLHTLKVVEVGAVQEAAAVRVEARPQAAQLLGQPRLARRVVRLQGALARQAPQALDPPEQALKRSVASLMAPPILEVTTIPVMIQAAPGTQAKCPPRLEPIASERQTRAEDHLAATRQQVPVPKLPVRRSIELAGKAAAVLTVRSRKAPKCPATLQFERKIRSSIRKSKAFARDVDRGSVVSERRHRSDNKRALAHSVCYAVEHSRGEMIVRIIWGMVLLTRLTVLPVSGAEVERHATAGGTVAISIAGEIVEGDAEALRLEIQRAQLANYPISEIQLNSIGGSLYEGTSLARVVRAASLNTRVAERNICASACFLVFAAGSTKSVQNGARVGVHAATTASGDNTQISIKATEAMGRIAKLLGVPSGIVERMVSTPASQMFWLNGANFVSMGAVITDGK